MMANQQRDYYTENELVEMGFGISRNVGDRIEIKSRYAIRMDDTPCIVGRSYASKSYVGYILISSEKLDVSSYACTNYGWLSQTTNYETIYVMAGPWRTYESTSVFLNKTYEITNIYKDIQHSISNVTTVGCKATVYPESIDFVNKLIRSAQRLKP